MTEQPTTPIPDLALTADISDGDFRTYVLICHLAWRNHPLAERPYTELGYEELATLHPGNGLTASAIRARIQRLAQAGLLVRERFDNVRWRTYPVIAQPEDDKLGAMPANTQTQPQNGWVLAPITPKTQDAAMGATPANTQVEPQDSWVLAPVAPNRKHEELGAMPDHTQTGLSELGATPDRTQVKSQDSWVLAPVAPNRKHEELGAMPDHTQTGLSEMGATPDRTQVKSQDSWVLAPVTPNCKQEDLGATPDHTQAGLSEMGATPANTQVEPQDSWVLAHVAPNRKHEELGAMPANTQTGLSEMGAIPASTQPAPDLTDLIDLDQDQINQSDQGGVGGVDLPAVLATLYPEPMSEEGITECLQQPELTAAWLAYVHDPGNGVQNPAAYLRRQVRRGKYPPLHGTPCLSIPAERRTHERTRRFASDTARNSGFAPALASLAVAPLAATRWPLDAS